MVCPMDHCELGWCPWTLEQYPDGCLGCPYWKEDLFEEPVSGGPDVSNCRGAGDPV